MATIQLTELEESQFFRMYREITIIGADDFPWCGNCQGDEAEHVNGKCLWQPTTFLRQTCLECDGVIKQMDICIGGHPSKGRHYVAHADCIYDEVKAVWKGMTDAARNRFSRVADVTLERIAKRKALSR